MTWLVIGALVVGLSLGIFGSGGSILTVPVLVYLLHHEDKVAIAESLGIVGTIALVSALPYARERLVDWRTAFLFGLPGMAGTWGGAWLGGLVSGAVQLIVFAAVMLTAAGLMWRGGAAAASSPGAGPDAAASVGPDAADAGRDAIDAGSPKADPRRSLGRIVLDGLAVGVLTGFVGVGGGFLIVPALVLLGGLSMRRAVATSLVIIALKSATGFWKYLNVLEDTGSRVDWGTMAAFAVVGSLGSLGGKLVNTRLDANALRRGFAGFLLVMALFILVREGTALLGGGPDDARSASPPAAVPVPVPADGAHDGRPPGGTDVPEAAGGAEAAR